jgi:hypothetical protein
LDQRKDQFLQAGSPTRAQRPLARLFITALGIVVACAATLLPIRIEGQTIESSVSVGYASSALVPSDASGVLPFQPGEDVLVQLARQVHIVLTGPDNRVIQDRVIGPTDVPLVLHTFATLDEPDEHRLWVNGELQPLRLLLERRFLNSGITARLTLADATVSARIENTRTRLAFFLTRGAPNYLTPGSELTPSFLVALGLAPLGGFHADVVLAYAAPMEFQLTQPESRLRLMPVVVEGIVQRTEEILPNGTYRFADRGLGLPALHAVAESGNVPLRYGVARLLIRIQEMTDFSPRPQNGSEIETQVYVIPAGLGDQEALADEFRLPFEEIVRAHWPKMLGIIGTEQRARLIMGELVIPAALVAVTDVNHGRPVIAYDLRAEIADSLRLDGTTALLFDDFVPGNFVFGLIGVPPRNVGYALQVNGFPTSAEPHNLTTQTGLRQVLLVQLVDLRVQLSPVLGQSPPELRIENPLGRYVVLAWNTSVSIPPGNYTVSAGSGERRVWIEIMVQDDLTVVLELPPEPFPAVGVLQLSAIAEIALLTSFLLHRRRWT